MLYMIPLLTYDTLQLQQQRARTKSASVLKSISSSCRIIDYAQENKLRCATRQSHQLLAALSPHTPRLNKKKASFIHCHSHPANKKTAAGISNDCMPDYIHIHGSILTHDGHQVHCQPRIDYFLSAMNACIFFAPVTLPTMCLISGTWFLPFYLLTTFYHAP